MVTLEYGGFWRRWLAFVIDGALTLMLLLPVLHLLGIGSRDILDHDVSFARRVIFNVPFLIASTLFLFYQAATPGKMLLDLKVVDAKSLGRLSFGQALGRQLAYIISILPFSLGFVWIAFDPRKQGWHDKLAGTLVVRKSGSDLPPSDWN